MLALPIGFHTWGVDDWFGGRLPKLTDRLISLLGGTVMKKVAIGDSPIIFVWREGSIGARESLAPSFYVCIKWSRSKVGDGSPIGQERDV